MDLSSRIHGMWLGKSIGGTLGLPAEGRTERLDFTYYDPVPDRAPPNDDLELQLVWLRLLERHGSDLDADILGQGWLDHIHYIWDEYGRCRWNLRRGVPAAAAGSYENWFASGMGSPIRSEIWACAAVGDARRAEAWARLDSALDHGPEGAAGEVFFTVLECLALAGRPLSAAFAEARARLDPTSETAAALRLVCDEHGRGSEVWATRDLLVANHGSDNFTHAPLNVALTAWALLFGAGDVDATLLLAVNGGWDTDCTCASAGAILGALGGPAGFARRWTDPIGDGVWLGPGMIGLDGAPTTLGELTARSVALAQQRLSPSLVPAPRSVELRHLSGTIGIRPRDGSLALPWANGELPAAVCAAGGGDWDWHPGEGSGKPHHLVCQAPGGARLLIDGETVIRCPPGTPYLPAVHRGPAATRTVFTPIGSRPLRVRVELDQCAARQAAGVILAEANRDLTPWTGEILPYPGRLPAG